MRHGIAEDATMPDDAAADSARALTSKGRKRVGQVAKVLGRFGIWPDVVLSSIHKRARQTAEEAIEELELNVRVETIAALGFDTDVAPVAKALAARAATERDDAVILVAGHQPQLGHLATLLISGEPRPMELKRASALLIDFDKDIAAGKGTLELALTARWARSFLR